MLKHFTFVFHEIDPHLPCVVINETHVAFASSNGFCLCGPHIWVDHFQRFGTYMSCLCWEWMTSLLPQLACFTNLWHHLFCSKFGKTSNKILFLHELKTLEINMANPLVPNSMSPTPFPCVNNMEFTLGMFISKVNICPFLSPFAINLLWFFRSSTKHPFGVNVTCKPCSTIWPTETKFFVMVGTWNTSFKYFVYPSCMDNGTLPICGMGCVMSSPISTNPSLFKSFVSLNHSPWLVIWFKAPESTY